MSILVIAAHPDDEILGCGATAALLADTEEVNALILGLGRNGTLKESAEKAAEIIGLTSIVFDAFPDQRYDSVPLLDITQVIEAHIDRFQPDTIFTHHRADLNRDHRITYGAVITACRPQPGTSVKRIYSFETLSSTEWQYPYVFNPTVFIDISTTIRRKTVAMQTYCDEIRNWPHPRSIQGILALAAYRGQQVGLEYAEAFELIREVK